MSAVSVSISHIDGQPRRVEIAPGDLIFLLGPNGTGKSTLLFRLKQQLGNRARIVVAHRAVWLETEDVQLTASNRQQVENNLHGQEASDQSRTRDTTTGSRNQIMLFDLADLENKQAQRVFAAVKEGDVGRAQQIAGQESPISTISRILQASGLPLEIGLTGGSVVARKAGYPEYGITKLSDGERNAVLIAAYAVTMPSNSILLLDEPERHLHRSIAAPLIASILELRPDCAFVVSTHELGLASENPSSRVLQIQGYAHDPQAWDFDEVAADTPIRESIASSILGMRRLILVVEGTSTSLDLQIYRILFPKISVVCKSTSSEVKSTVAGINDSQEHHRCKAFGIVDGDAMTEADRTALIERGIYPLDFYSVEYLYYCREVFEWVIRNHVISHGIDAEEAIRRYETAILSAMIGNRERLVSRVCEYAARREALSGLPTWEGIANRGVWQRTINLDDLFQIEAAKFDAALSASNSQYFLFRFPFRESNLPGLIAGICGLSDRSKYEHLVRSLAARSCVLRDLISSKLGQVVEALVKS